VTAGASSSLRHALVLTAGLGTRLQPLTFVRAKPAIPLGGEPLIRRIVRWLVHHDVTELVLNLHYKPESIAGVLGDGADLGARVRYSWEQPDVLGSAGGPRLAAPLVGVDQFLIVNGDTLTDLDLSRLVSTHRASDALVTLALVPNTQPEQYGGIRLEEDRVVGFVPRGASARGSFHFIGVQMAAACAFETVRTGQAAQSIGGVYDRLMARRPGAIHGYVCDASFWDIGTVADYWRTSLAFGGGADIISRGAGVQTADDAVIRQSIVWDRVQIGRGAVLENCIVTDDVTVHPGDRWTEMILRKGPDGVLATPFAATATASASSASMIGPRTAITGDQA
jgi:mannose-1-phosphate guanylyltransferase